MNKKEVPHQVVTLLRELGGVKRALAKTNSIINAVQTARFEQYPRLNPDRFTGLSYIEQAGRVSGIAEALKEQAEPHLVNRRNAITKELVGHIGKSADRGMIAGVIFEKAEEELTSLMGIAAPPRPTAPKRPSITREAPSRAVKPEGKPTEPSVEEELPLPPYLFPLERRIVTAVKAEGAEGLPRDALAHAVWPDQPLDRSVTNLRQTIKLLNRKLRPAGFQLRNIVPLGRGMKAVYRYEQYTPPPTERDLPKMRIVRRNAGQVTVAVDGRETTFHGVAALKMLLFLMYHSNQDIPTKALTKGTELEGYSISQVCRQLVERLDPENHRLITWGGPTRHDYHYRLNAEVEPFEPPEPPPQPSLSTEPSPVSRVAVLHAVTPDQAVQARLTIPPGRIEPEYRLAASITISQRILTHFAIVVLSPLVFEDQGKTSLPNDPLKVLEESVTETESLLHTLSEKMKEGVPKIVIRTFLIHSLIRRIECLWEMTNSKDVKERSAIQFCNRLKSLERTLSYVVTELCSRFEAPVPDKHRAGEVE